MLWLMFIGITIMAYLIGAIPVGGIIAGLKGIDLRQHGSGKLGTTNVLRTIGRRAAVLVLVGDFLKGSLAVGLAKLIASSGNVYIQELSGHLIWLDTYTLEQGNPCSQQVHPPDRRSRWQSSTVAYVLGPARGRTFVLGSCRRPRGALAPQGYHYTCQTHQA